jgi:hypothetical protein
MQHPTQTEIQHLIDRAHALGWTLELKEFCEDAETPGFLGSRLGICVMSRKAIKIRTSGRTQAQIVAAIEHELRHATGTEEAGDDDAHGIRCGGSRRGIFGL